MPQDQTKTTEDPWITMMRQKHKAEIDKSKAPSPSPSATSKPKKIDPSSIDLSSSPWTQFSSQLPGAQDIRNVTQPNADYIRPFLGDAARLGVKKYISKAGPIGAGAYVLGDIAAQHMGEPKAGFVARQLGLDPNKVGTDVVDALESLAMDWGIGAGMQAGSRSFGAYRNIPELRFQPTTGQALTAQGDPLNPSMMAKLVTAIENKFSPQTKRLSQLNSAGLINKEAGNVLEGVSEGTMGREVLGDPNLSFSSLESHLPTNERIIPKTVRAVMGDKPIRFMPAGPTITDIGNVTSTGFTRPIKVTQEFMDKNYPQFADLPLKQAGEIINSQGRVMPKGPSVQNVGPYTPVMRENIPRPVISPARTTNIIKETALAENPQQLADLIRDPKKLQDALSRGQSMGSVNENLRQRLAGARFNEIWTNNVKKNTTDPSKWDIDYEGLMNSMNDPAYIQSHGKLFNKQTQSNMSDFFKEIAITQRDAVPNKAIHMTPGGASIAGLLWTAANHPGILAGAATVSIAMPALSKILSKPTAAKILTNMAGKHPLGMPVDIAMKVLSKALTGHELSIINKDGTEIKGKLDKEGMFNPYSNELNSPGVNQNAPEEGMRFFVPQ